MIKVGQVLFVCLFIYLFLRTFVSFLLLTFFWSRVFPGSSSFLLYL